MNLEEFRAKCAAAIAEWHDPKVDGPLLVSILDTSSYSPSLEEWEEPYPKYAAAIGNWLVGYFGGVQPEYSQFTSDVIADLVWRAKKLWQQRQPEPEEEHDSEPRDPFAGTAWACGR